MRVRYLLADTARYYFRYLSIKTGMIVAVVGMIAAILVGFGYWWPARSDAQDLVALVDLKRKQIIDEHHAKEIYAAYSAASGKVVFLEKKLIGAAGQAALVNIVDNLAVKRDLVIISASYDKGKERNGYEPLYLDLVLQGNYKGLRGFFSDLYSLPAWSFVEEASLHRMQGQQNMVKAQLRLVSYHAASKVIVEDSPL